MKALIYIRLSMRAKGFKQATTILLLMIAAGFIHGGWLGGLIITGMFLPYYLTARYEHGKAMIETATRRLRGGERRMRPRRPPPPPCPPPLRSRP